MREDYLVTYDVNTQDASGRRRLRKVATLCTAYGQRVQYSVFECTVNPVQLQGLRSRLAEVIDERADSLRIYKLRGDRADYLERFGRDSYVDFEAPLVV